MKSLQNFIKKVNDAHWFTPKKFDQIEVNGQSYIVTISGWGLYSANIFSMYDLEIPYDSDVYQAIQDRSPIQVPWNYTFLDELPSSLLYSLVVRNEKRMSFGYDSALSVANDFKEKCENGTYLQRDQLEKVSQYYPSNNRRFQKFPSNSWGRSVEENYLRFPQGFNHFSRILQKAPLRKQIDNYFQLLPSNERQNWELVKDENLINQCHHFVTGPFYNSYRTIIDEISVHEQLLLKINHDYYLFNHAKVFYAKTEHEEQRSRTVKRGDKDHTEYYYVTIREPVLLDSHISTVHQLEQHINQGYVNLRLGKTLVSPKQDKNLQVLDDLLQQNWEGIDNPNYIFDSKTKSISHNITFQMIKKGIKNLFQYGSILKIQTEEQQVEGVYIGNDQIIKISKPRNPQQKYNILKVQTLSGIIRKECKVEETQYPTQYDEHDLLKRMESINKKEWPYKLGEGDKYQVLTYLVSSVRYKKSIGQKITSFIKNLF